MTETKPASNTNIQTKDSSGMVVSIEAIKKPEGANKAQELAAMEEALKKATEEAHKQRLAITTEEPAVSTFSQNASML